ncbi:MAG: hypothetical protein J2P23_05945 [Microlunatus sp.]|nr:hypothetical protein [Microlunatus sp.]
MTRTELWKALKTPRAAGIALGITVVWIAAFVVSVFTISTFWGSRISLIVFLIGCAILTAYTYIVRPGHFMDHYRRR